MAPVTISQGNQLNRAWRGQPGSVSVVSLDCGAWIIGVNTVLLHTVLPSVLRLGSKMGLRHRPILLAPKDAKDGEELQ